MIRENLMKILNFSSQNKAVPKRKAQGMIEFALIIPVLLLIIVGLLEFGRLLFAWLVVENSTRFGIRYATAGSFNDVYCTTDLDGDVPPTFCDGDSRLEEIRYARWKSIEDETRRIIVGFYANETLANTEPDFLNVTVCSDDPTDSVPTLSSSPIWGGLIMRHVQGRKCRTSR